MAKKIEGEVPTPPKHHQHIESPLAEYPGYIVLPTIISAPDFLKWIALDEARTERTEKATRGEREKDPRPHAFQQLECAWHIIKGFNVEGVHKEHLEAEDGSRLPAMPMVMWLLASIAPLLASAWSVPNSLEPSSDT